MALKRFLFSLMNQGSPKNTFLRTGLRFGISPTFPSFHVALQNSAIFVGMIASKNGQIWSPPLCFYSISGCWMVKQRIGPPPPLPIVWDAAQKSFFRVLPYQEWDMYSFEVEFLIHDVLLSYLWHPPFIHYSGKNFVPFPSHHWQFLKEHDAALSENVVSLFTQVLHWWHHIRTRCTIHYLQQTGSNVASRPWKDYFVLDLHRLLTQVLHGWHHKKTCWTIRQFVNLGTTRMVRHRLVGI